jgi:RHS repeat-associated protein
MVLAQDGTVKEALMYQPYGAVSDVDEIAAARRLDPLRQKFTTKEFDEEGPDFGQIKFDLTFDFALTNTDPTKLNRVEVYYADAPSNPEIIYVTLDPSDNKYKVTATLNNATSRTIASIKFKLNDDAVCCNVQNINEVTNPGSKLTITKTASAITEFTPTVLKTFLNYSNESFYMAGIGGYHFGARVYDPDIGIFQSTDPMDVFWNSYSYNGGDPVNLIDPSGMSPIGITTESVMADIDQILNVGMELADELTNISNFFAMGSKFLANGELNPYYFSHIGNLTLSEYAFQQYFGIDLSNRVTSLYQIPNVSIDAPKPAIQPVVIDAEFNKQLWDNSWKAVKAQWTSPTAWAFGVTGLLLGYEAVALRLSIATPYGNALQSMDYAAIAARTQVNNGATLYRLGSMGKSAAGEGQFWSFENPLNAGYPARYGMPAANVTNANFVETATLRPGTPFITRPAPAIGANPGGGIEVVVPQNGVYLQSFSAW